MQYQKKYLSPVGLIYMISDGEFLTGLCFENSQDSLKYNINHIDDNLPIFDETKRWLDIYFGG